MILVTGAAGKTGRAVIQALSAGGVTVRALVHKPGQIQTVEALGAQEVYVGDMRDRFTMERAAQGAHAIYHIPPNVSPSEYAIGETIIAAAQSAGLEHFIFHSVLHPQTEAMPHHWQKLRVEELLLESGLAYTILQPAIYMQNVLAHWDQIIKEGEYPVPYAVETRLSMVDLEDVAQVAALVSKEPGHAGATYELVGTEAMSQSECAKILSKQLGRPVRAKAIPVDVWERQARALNLDDYQVETLVKMFHYYERYGFQGNPRVLNWLLNRSPTSFTAFVERTIQKRRHEEQPFPNRHVNHKEVEVL